MTKFEEDLNKKMDLKEVPMYFTQSGCSMTRKTYIETNWVFDTYKNWHSDEEFQELFDKYSNLNDNYEKEVIRSSNLETSNLKLIAKGTGLLSDNAMLTKKVEDLKSKLQQQALPVVPDYVGNAVMKINLEHLFTGYTNGINEKAKNWLERHKGVKSLGYYVCQLRFQGFTIEKPQLFRLKLKNATISNYYLWLNQATGKVFVDKKFLDWTNHNNVKNIFTEQEITKISDGAFVNNEAFELVPVEDGE